MKDRLRDRDQGALAGREFLVALVGEFDESECFDCFLDDGRRIAYACEPGEK
ncbi:MAG: hypothetical protein WD313_00925 [Acidimicrobiia bacterium]